MDSGAFSGTLKRSFPLINEGAPTCSALLACASFSIEQIVSGAIVFRAVEKLGALLAASVLT